jgi:acyl-CoA hydrolase
MTLVEVSGLLSGGQVEIDGLAVASAAAGRPADADDPSADAVIRLRLAPSDARYAGRLAAGSKAMEIFADLETELALREGGDEGICVADMVEFLEPLRAGDFVEGRARVVSRGRSSRRITAEMIYKALEVDEAGVLIPQDAPKLAARASVTIVVGRTPRGQAG